MSRASLTMSKSLALKLCLLAAVWTPGQGVGWRRSDDSDSLKAVVENLARELANTQVQLESQKQEITALKASTGRTVAFSAWISHEPSIQASQGATVSFAGIHTNVGGAYSPTSSAFTAPFSGLYFFIVHVDCTVDYRSMNVNVNGHLAIGANNDHADGHVTGSGLLTLKVGDVVTATHYLGVGAVDAGKESTFTGFLVK